MSKESHFSFDNLFKEFACSLKFICTLPAAFGNRWQDAQFSFLSMLNDDKTVDKHIPDFYVENMLSESFLVKHITFYLMPVLFVRPSDLCRGSPSYKFF